MVQSIRISLRPAMSRSMLKSSTTPYVLCYWWVQFPVCVP
uniref:Uncharacterized protein n=1 Tax=Anguilla anguilla TaxID=7936 RepID=A0A0E9V3H8_ANGAN